VLAVSKQPNLGIYVFEKGDGELERAFYLYDLISTSELMNREAVDIKMDDDEIIYVLLQLTDSYEFMAFDFDDGSATITPLYYYRYGSGGNEMTSITISYHFDDEFAYIGGSLTGLPSITKIDLDDGT